MNCDRLKLISPKKEYYNFLIQTGYDKLNREDYFELGFLSCNDEKNILKLFIQFTEFMNKTLKSIKKIRRRTRKGLCI